MFSRLKHRSGFTLVELMVALSISCLVVLGTAELLIDSTRASDKMQTQGTADQNVALAVEKIKGLIGEARTVTIDVDGCGLTYRCPAKNSDGSYVSSEISTEPNDHRIYLQNGTLYSSDPTASPANATSVILKNVPTIDPDTKTALRIFQNGPIAGQFIIRLASSPLTSRNNAMPSTITTVVQARNM
jgi:prepilin-type N-terminal cleavage/methylation domain-containing protein